FEATKMDNLQGVEPFRDTPVPKGDFKELKAAVVKQADDLEVFETAEVLVKVADEGKVPVAQLREALAPALKAAQEYGDPWRQECAFLLAQRLSGREAYAGFGEEVAREALKLAGAAASADLQLRGLGIVATALEKQKKTAELAKVREQVAALEVRGHEEYEK